MANFMMASFAKYSPQVARCGASSRNILSLSRARTGSAPRPAVRPPALAPWPLLATVVSIAAILLSAVTFAFSYRASRAAERRARMPVLVFLYDGAQGWLLRNVGNGPALNIEVAQKIVGGEQAGGWINPVRVAPMGRDKEVLLSWLRDDSLHGLGAVYEDFLGADEGAAGRAYTVTCGNDRNIVKPGRHLPKWPESEIVAQWRATQFPGGGQA
jgi:hypothetical protein